jgi:acylphosphatase
MEQTAKHVIFQGRVQGVGFRYTARQIAGRYHVAGYVRNLPDGSVEMLLQGPAADVDDCIRDVQDEFAGYIRDTQVEPEPYNARYQDFRIAF